MFRHVLAYPESSGVAVDLDGEGVVLVEREVAGSDLLAPPMSRQPGVEHHLVVVLGVVEARLYVQEDAPAILRAEIQ